MIVFLLLLLILVGLVYYFSRGRPSKEGFYDICGGFYIPDDVNAGRDTDRWYIYFADQYINWDTYTKQFMGIFDTTTYSNLKSSIINLINTTYISQNGARLATDQEKMYYYWNGGYDWSSNNIASGGTVRKLIITKINPLQSSDINTATQSSTLVYNNNDPSTGQWVAINRYSSTNTSTFTSISFTKSELINNTTTCRANIETIANNNRANLYFSTNFQTPPAPKLRLLDSGAVTFTVPSQCVKTMYSIITGYSAGVSINYNNAPVIQSCSATLNKLRDNYIKYGSYTQFADCFGLVETDLGTDVNKGPYTPAPQPLTATPTSTSTGVEFRITTSADPTFTADSATYFTYYLQIGTVPASTFAFPETIEFKVTGNPFPLTLTFNEETRKIKLTGSNDKFIPVTTNGEINYPANFRIYNDIKYIFTINTIKHSTADTTPPVTGKQLGDLATQNPNTIETIFSSAAAAGAATGTAVGRKSLWFMYSTTKPNRVQATFNYVDASNNQQSRNLPAGNYKFFFDSATGQDINLLPINRMEIDITTGSVYFYNGATELTQQTVAQTTIREGAAEKQFNIKIKDASGVYTYYDTTYELKPTRYAAASAAPAATETSEVVLIEIKGRKAALAEVNAICQGLGGRIATIEDLQKELAAGANWHTPGWVYLGVDGNRQSIYRAAYPLTEEAVMEKYGGSVAARAGTIVVGGADLSGNALVSNILCYRPKEAVPTNKTLGGLELTQGEFNTIRGQWSRKSQPKQLEVYMVTQGGCGGDSCLSFEDAAAAVDAVPATVEQLQASMQNLPGTALNPLKPFMPEYARVLNRTPGDAQAVEQVYRIPESGAIESTPATDAVKNYFLYGYKRGATAPAGLTIVFYNATLNIYSRYDLNEYKTYTYSSAEVAAKIAAETNLLRKAALIVQDVQAHPTAFLRQDAVGKSLNGCGTEAVACLPLENNKSYRVDRAAFAESRTGRYTTRLTFQGAPTTLQGAISDVLSCQERGGSVPTHEGEFPGCSGECCAPETGGGGGGGTTLDESMFAQTCAPNKEAEQCSPEQEPSALPVRDAPFTLRRVNRRPPHTAPTCARRREGFVDAGALREIQYLYKQAHLAGRQQRLN